MTRAIAVSIDRLEVAYLVVEFLREPLAAYITRLTVPTKLVHLEERSGLIRARLRGSGMALGEVLLFLDAHVEVSVGWLEPLIARVAGNR
jgi:polypeptide N-acetylgalactosaminyltransferase